MRTRSIAMCGAGVSVLLLLIAAPLAGQDSYRQIIELQNRAQTAVSTDVEASLIDQAASLKLAAGLDRPRLVAVLFQRLGRTYETSGKIQNAVSAYESGLKALADDTRFDVQQDLNQLRLVRKGYDGAAPTIPDLYSDQLAADLAIAESDEALAVNLLIAIGNAYLQQPQPDPARNAYERALKRGEIASMPRLRGYALANLGEALRRLGERDRAEAQLNEALALLRSAAPEIESRRALGLLAGLHRDGGRPEQAITEYTEALALYQRTTDPRGEGRTYAGLGLLHLQNRRFAEALGAYQRSVQLGEQVKDPELLWHAYWGLGVALRNTGDLEAAATNLQKGLDIIESRQQELTTDEGKVSLLDSAQQAYEELIKVHLEASPMHDQSALDLAERSRARAMGDLMGSGPRNSFRCFETITKTEDRGPRQMAPAVRSVVVPVDDPRCAGVRANLNCTAILAPQGDSPPQRAPGVPSGPVPRVDPDCAPEMKTTGDAPPPLARLVFHTLDDRTVVFAVTPSGEVRTHVVLVTRIALQRRVTKLRDSLGVDGAGRGVSSDAATSGGNDEYLSQLEQLYADLIEPVAAVLPIDQTVVIEPHGPLWLVPFAALRTADGRWLGDRWRLIYAPSSQMLNDIRAEPAFRRPADLKALVIGNPTAPTLAADSDLFRGGRVRADFSPLPGAESEARMIGDLLPESQRTVLLRAAATVDAVTSDVSDITVLHLATHALASAGRPLDSFVMLAPSAHDDGRLTARQIMNLSFRADLVTLSACQTGLGQLSGDGVIGLSRAFLDAAHGPFW